MYKVELFLNKKNNIEGKVIEGQFITNRENDKLEFLGIYKDFNKLELQEWFNPIAALRYSISEENKLIKISDELFSKLKKMDVKLNDETNLRTEIKNCNIKNGILIGGSDQLQEKFNDIKTIISKYLKEGIVIRDIQWKQIMFMALFDATANFSVPGSGKTIVTLASYLYLREKGKVKSILIIGPSSSFDVWREEWKNFFLKYDFNLPSTNYYKLNEEKQKDRTELLESLDKTAKMVVMHYATISTQLIYNNIWKDAINNLDKLMIVIDEVHYIKNNKKVWGSYFKDLTAAKKIIMTGTPVPNSFNDLKSYFNFMFGEMMSKTINSHIDTAIERDEVNLDLAASELSKVIEPWYIRVNKRDLQINNETNEIVSQVEIDSLQESLLKELRECNLQNPLVKGLWARMIFSNPLAINSINNELGSVMEREFSDLEGNISENNLISKKLSDINNPGNKFIPKTPIPEDYRTPSFIKNIEVIKKLAKENKKVLVWSNFINTMELISKELNRLGIKNLVYNGRKNHNQRSEIIRTFKKEEGPVVLIASPQTLSESVSLHKVCWDAIYFDISYNYIHWEQSKNRIHRLGLPMDAVINYYLCATRLSGQLDSIDERIFNALERKMNRQEKLVDRGILEVDDSNNIDYEQHLKDILEGI